MGVLRLQMHATAPDPAEQTLGTSQSVGCVCIAALLNEFVDRQGLRGEDCERSLAAGRLLWVLRRDRTPTACPGRYMVVVDAKSP